MAERKWGLFKSGDDNSFESADEIRKRKALQDQLPVHDKRRKSPTLDRRLEILEQRSEQFKELSPRSENQIKIRLKYDSTLNIIADTHLGDPRTDVRRLRREIEVIRNTPNSYVLLAGDIINGIFWGGASQAEEIAGLDEQRELMRSLFRTLRGKVIVGISGQHDSKWAAKTGSDPYSDFSELTKAPYIRGVAEIDLGVGRQDYKIVAQHNAKGHSMYNKNHPTFREARFHLQGADIYISADTHQKQIAQETIREFGKARMVTHISVGPYKSADEYTQRSGYPNQKPQEMFGAAIRVHADQKLVEVNYDILEANRIWR